jgi:hypothetical protein
LSGLHRAAPLQAPPQGSSLKGSRATQPGKLKSRNCARSSAASLWWRRRRRTERAQAIADEFSPPFVLKGGDSFQQVRNAISIRRISLSAACIFVICLIK